MDTHRRRVCRHRHHFGNRGAGCRRAGQGHARPPQYHLHTCRRPWLRRPVVLREPLCEDSQHRQPGPHGHVVYAELRRERHIVAFKVRSDDRKEHRQDNHTRQPVHCRGHTRREGVAHRRHHIHTPGQPPAIRHHRRNRSLGGGLPHLSTSGTSTATTPWLRPTTGGSTSSTGGQ